MNCSSPERLAMFRTKPFFRSALSSARTNPLSCSTTILVPMGALPETSNSSTVAKVVQSLKVRGVSELKKSMEIEHCLEPQARAIERKPDIYRPNVVYDFEPCPRPIPTEIDTFLQLAFFRPGPENHTLHPVIEELVFKRNA